MTKKCQKSWFRGNGSARQTMLELEKGGLTFSTLKLQFVRFDPLSLLLVSMHLHSGFLSKLEDYLQVSINANVAFGC